MKNTRLPSSTPEKNQGRSLVAGLATLLLDDVGELLDLALRAEEGAELEKSVNYTVQLLRWRRRDMVSEKTGG